MVRFTGGLLLFTALSLAAPSQHNKASAEAQQVLTSPVTSQASKLRRLQGKFLHITDIHPDPFYTTGTDPSGEHPCHAGKGEVDAGYYGAPITECDTPFSLVNATFKWIEENLKDEIDFVVWTGDSARHDNDYDLPRSTRQVEDLNRFIVDKFVETFGKTDNIHDHDPTNDFIIPIIPTFGNNDILPHNIFEPGPNKWTRKYINIWQKFVPEDQYHSFERGGWFFTEVIPDKLAVFSLNTLYFFDNNSAVDGCDAHTEPGYEHMEWLRIQLQFLRKRGMKAILTGHVPPARTESRRNWEESCYQKYTLWLRQYRDVIIGSLYGHMNIDHFMFQDVRDLTYKFKIDGVDDNGLQPKDYSSNSTSDDQIHTMAKTAYLNDLRASWSDLPTPPKGISYAQIEDSTLETIIPTKNKNQKEKEKFLKDIGGEWGERFSMSLVSPSVVPNYFPTLRIIEYNITGLEHCHPAMGAPLGTPAEASNMAFESEEDQYQFLDQSPQFETEPDSGLNQDEPISTSKKNKKKKKHHKNKNHPSHKPNFPVPKPPHATTPPGPAYSPQTFTFLSWTQLYANLTKIHENMETFTETSSSSFSNMTTTATTSTTKPKDRSQFNYKIEYTTSNDSAYRLPDLTIRSWLDIAERIGRNQYPSLSQSYEEEVELEDETYEEAMNMDAAKRKHRKHKVGGKLSANHLWHAFVRRAYVHTKAEAELESEFG